MFLNFSFPPTIRVAFQNPIAMVSHIKAFQLDEVDFVFFSYKRTIGIYLEFQTISLHDTRITGSAVFTTCR